MSNEFKVGPDRDKEGNPVYPPEPENDRSEQAQQEFMEDQADRHGN